MSPLSSQPSYSRVPNQQPSPYLDQEEELEAAFDDSSEQHLLRNRNEDDEDREDSDDDSDHEDSRKPSPLQASSSSQPRHATLNHSSTPKPTPQSHHLTYAFSGIDSSSSSNRFLSPSSNMPSTTPSRSSTPALGPPSLVKLAGMGGGVQNDGVFANLSAKPDGPGARMNPTTGELEYVGGNDEDGHPNDKEDVLPTYDTAALDSAPPYWETTVTLPGMHSGPYGLLGPDDVLVDGLPVGNLFGFAWNLLVSMSFQFIGFLLTYLLHTTHAAKNGSRAGLGITLIQYGLYTRSRALEGTNGGDSSRGGAYNSSSSVPPTTTDPWGLFGPSSRTDWDGSTDHGKGTHNLPYDGIPSDHSQVSGTANEWLGYILIAVGWFLLLGGLVNYWRAVRWARAVRSEEILVGTLA